MKYICSHSVSYLIIAVLLGSSKYKHLVTIYIFYGKSKLNLLKIGKVLKKFIIS